MIKLDFVLKAREQPTEQADRCSNLSHSLATSLSSLLTL